MLRFRASAIRFRHISESMCFSVGPDIVGLVGLEPDTAHGDDFPSLVVRFTFAPQP